jgi:hypothetical protein
MNLTTCIASVSSAAPMADCSAAATVLVASSSARLVGPAS